MGGGGEVKKQHGSTYCWKTSIIRDKKNLMSSYLPSFFRVFKVSIALISLINQMLDLFPSSASYMVAISLRSLCDFM